MAKEYKHKENDAVIAAEPIVAYGNVAYREAESCTLAVQNLDSDIQRAIPIETFRQMCHDELRRMYE